MMRTGVVALTLTALGATSVGTAELQLRSVAAFNRYVRLAETQATAGPFLAIDGLPEPRRRAKLAELGRGQLLIDRLATETGGRAIEIPDAIIHHWIGTMFVPHGT